MRKFFTKIVFPVIGLFIVCGLLALNWPGREQKSLDVSVRHAFTQSFYNNRRGQLKTVQGIDLQPSQFYMTGAYTMSIENIEYTELTASKDFQNNFAFAVPFAQQMKILGFTGVLYTNDKEKWLFQLK